MSDEELIARLRSDHPDYLTIAAADRIKQLVAKYDEVIECNEEFFVYNQILKERCGAQQTEITALRAKLARIASAWPIVRDADCSGGTLASAMDEIEAAISDGAADGGKHE